jgi:hypothetical protein
MDPFLEGYRFHDFHNSMIFTCKRLLAPQLVPRYVPSIESYTVLDNNDGSTGIDIMYPDLGVFIGKDDKVEEPSAVYEKKLKFTPPTMKVDAEEEFGLRIPYLEIRDKGNHKLVTVIELLSPINKRAAGRAAYREKCGKLHAAGVHLLEIDLLRRGERAFRNRALKNAHYGVRLFRGNGTDVDIWTIDIKDKLPVLPVPLQEGDDDAILDLGMAFDLVYTESLYDRIIEYDETPPPPDFTKREKEWLQSRIAAFKKKA